MESITILNPECEIYDSYFTIFNDFDEYGRFRLNGTIYGYANSTAQAYAEKYDYNFSVIGSESDATTPSVTTTVTTTKETTASESTATTASQTETSASEETTVSTVTTTIDTTATESTATTVSQISTSDETTVSTVTTSPITKRTNEQGQIVIIMGDADDNGKLTASDAAYIAKMLADASISGKKLIIENNYAADYNGDGKITAQDCSDIASYLAKLSIINYTTAPNEHKTETTQTTVKLQEPNKKNYDLNKFSGIKAYVNDCIKYKAAAEYGITKIIYDDTVDLWKGYSWDIPADYIPNVEYYKEHTDPILPAGFRTTADELVSESYCALYMMVEEWKVGYAQLREQGFLEDCSEKEYISMAELTVTWKSLGGGNYQLYIMW